MFSRSHNKGKTAPRRQIPALTGYGFSFLFSRSYTKEKQHFVKLRILRNAPRKESTARHGRKSQLSVRESLSARAHLQEPLRQSHGGCRNHSLALGPSLRGPKIIKRNKKGQIANGPIKSMLFSIFWRSRVLQNEQFLIKNRAKLAFWRLWEVILGILEPT